MRIIKAIDYNWFWTNESGCDYQTFIVGQHGVSKITAVSEFNAVAYRVEFEDGRSYIIFNPNIVFEEETINTGLVGKGCD